MKVRGAYDSLIEEIEAAAMEINEIEAEAEADRRTPERQNEPDQMDVVDNGSAVNEELPHSLRPQ
jgi:hypothetical protein